MATKAVSGLDKRLDRYGDLKGVNSKFTIVRNSLITAISSK